MAVIYVFLYLLHIAVLFDGENEEQDIKVCVEFSYLTWDNGYADQSHLALRNIVLCYFIETFCVEADNKIDTVRYFVGQGKD